MNYKKIIHSLLIALILFFSITLFANEKVYTEEDRSIIVTQKNPLFTLKLKSNPTTGYSWFLRDYDTKLLKPIEQNFVKSDQPLMGSSGYETWTFSVKPDAFVVPHQTTLELIYARPWQMDGGRKLSFQISIQSGK